MEEWTRSLAGVLTAGVGLEQALIVTLRATPRPIQTEASTLQAACTHGSGRWLEQALGAFADDLDDATGDLIAAKLVLAANRRGPGLASVLESLAESVAADVRARRQIEADRDKPRATVRWITVITVLALVMLALNTTTSRRTEPVRPAAARAAADSHRRRLPGLDAGDDPVERAPRFIGQSLVRSVFGRWR